MLIWLRVPQAFFVRDFQIEISYKAGFALGMIGVMLNVAIYYFVTRVFGGVAAPYLQSYGGSYFAFVIIGIAFSDYMVVGMGAMSSSLRSEQVTGTLELMLLSPTRLPIMLLSSSLWSYAFATLSVLVYLLMGVALGMGLEHANVPFALLSLAVAISCFNALGFFAASLMLVIKYGDPFGWLIRVSSMVLGGVFYPVEVLPQGLRLVGQALPLTHALELLRRSLLRGDGIVQLWRELFTLIVLTLILLPLSLLACSLAIRIARMNGSLSHY